MVGVQDAFGSISNTEGIDVTTLFEYNKSQGNIVGFKGSRSLPSEDFFSLDCDICIPAALGNQVTVNNAPDIKAKVIAEGANGPTDVEAEEMLLARGVEILPDILCNSGGVIGSYYEWLQNRNGEIWSLEEVMQKLEKKLYESFRKVIDVSQKRGVDKRTAAFIIAIERLEEAYVQRGIFP